MKSRILNTIINTITCKNFWGNVDKIAIPVSNNPLCLSEFYYYYPDAKLLLRLVNGKIVGHVCGVNADIQYNILGGEAKVSKAYLIQLMADISKFSTTEIVSNSRKEELVYCRFIIMWHYKNLKLRNLIDIKDEGIGNLFGKDRVTTIHAFNSVEEEEKYKKEFQKRYKSEFICHMKDIYDFYKDYDDGCDNN